MILRWVLGAPRPVHPLQVLLVVVGDRLPLELEGGGDEAGLGGPEVLHQRHRSCR